MLFRKSKPTNPILWREMLYQERNIPRWLGILDTVGIVGVVIVINFICAFYYINRDESGYKFAYFAWVNTYEHIQVVIWIIYLMTIIRTIIAGVDVMRRDNPHRLSSELLSITTLSTTLIVFAKVWSALSRTKAWYVAYGLAQLSLLFIMSMKYSIGTIAYYCASYSDCYPRDVYWINNNREGFTVALIACTVVISFSFFKLVCCILIGMLTSIVSSRTGFAILLGVILRLLPVVVFALFPDNPPYNLIYLKGLLFRVQEFTWFGFTGSSIIGIMRLAFLVSRYYPASFARAILALNAALVTLSILTGLAGSLIYLLIRRKMAD